MVPGSVACVNENDWPAYLAEITSNASAIARAVDVSASTVSRWNRGLSRPDAGTVIALARAFDRSPVIALVAAGYITRAEVEGQVALTPGMSLAEFSELEIAQELVRRIEAGETTVALDEPAVATAHAGEVDHPSWANVGGDAQSVQTDSAAHRTSADLVSVDGQLYIEVKTDGMSKGLERMVRNMADAGGTSFAIPKVAEDAAALFAMLSEIGREIEMNYAAKSDAVEIEEDVHQP